MSEAPNNRSEEEQQLAAAIDEYIESMTADDAAGFRIRCAADPVFRQAVGEAIGQMAMLVAAAHVVDDEDEFETIADELLAQAVLDTAAIRQLRNYYLANSDLIDTAAFAGNPARASRRLQARHADYLALHG